MAASDERLQDADELRDLADDGTQTEADDPLDVADLDDEPDYDPAEPGLKDLKGG
jgi:hypothetical protein